jgi:molecular chaperone GrpE (heat shock protein)
LQRELQSLRLEIEEYGRKLETLTEDLERQQAGESARIAQAVQAQLEKSLTEMAAPIAQLRTQAHLLEMEGEAVPATDVLAVAKRLVRALEDEGLTLEGGVGETTSFDPNRHAPARRRSLNAGPAGRRAPGRRRLPGQPDSESGVEKRG